MSNQHHPQVVEPEDVDFEDEDVEETEAPAKEPKVKAAKEPKNPKRGTLPEGYCTPVAFAKIITELGLETDEDGDPKIIAPQVVYSTIKNAPKDHPFPNTEGNELLFVKDDNDVDRRAFKIDEGVEWWKAKVIRTAERKANAKAKAAKKPEKLQAGPPGEDGEEDFAEEAE
jgi:hypothetical protein